MTDITVIILVGREERHLARCLERLAPLAPRQIFVVESQTGDRTHEIFDRMKASCAGDCRSVFRAWPGTQAAQFNWALDNLPVSGEWVLRLDADEYLTAAGMAWLRERMGRSGEGEAWTAQALEFRLERRFCGGEIRHGTNAIPLVRMFRRGRARYAEGGMDERFVVAGRVESVPVTFYDDSLLTMSEWRAKHRGYAKREAAQAVESLRTGVWTDPRKATYYKLPRYLRAVAYFVLRYFVRGGFRDGYAGWMWHFWQGLWYRLLVDREIGRLRRFLV